MSASEGHTTFHVFLIDHVEASKILYCGSFIFLSSFGAVTGNLYIFSLSMLSLIELINNFTFVPIINLFVMFIDTNIFFASVVLDLVDLTGPIGGPACFSQTQLMGSRDQTIKSQSRFLATDLATHRKPVLIVSRGQ